MLFLACLDCIFLVVDDDCIVRMKNEIFGDWRVKEIENNI